MQAACWLDRLVWADDSPAEWRMPLNKLLCALPLNTPFDPIAALDIPNSDTALNHVERELAQIQGLRQCGLSDIRALFLQRPGYLTQKEEAWHLVVDTDASDILLRDLPWPMDEIWLPWLDAPLHVHWL